MLAFITAILVLVGFVALVLAASIALSAWLDDRVIEIRPAAEADDPTAHSLTAAGRISAAAFETEHLMHTLAQQAKREEEQK